MTARQLRDKVEKRVHREQELVISPAYFFKLQSRISKLSRVEIRPLHGYADNEMSGYRYQAIMHVGLHREVPSEIEWVDWTAEKWTLDGLRSILREQRDKTIGIKRIRNARIEKDLEAMALLGVEDATYTAGELRRELMFYRKKGLHPQDLFDLEAEGLGFRVFLSWSACRRDGSYDALFVPKSLMGKEPFASVRWPEPEASEFVRLTNGPGQSKQRSDLITLLRTHCIQNLPEEMVPKEIELVDTLPYAQNGAVDGRALLPTLNRSFWP